MNKMFTAVATLQLVEAGKLALDDPIGKHLPDYPNKEVAAKVTVRHLLTHTGGTGDIFGPEFEQHRLQLREHQRLPRALRLARARPRARRALRVLELRLRAARRAHRAGERRVVLRLRSRPRLPPGRHDVHGLAAGIRGRARPRGRIHADSPGGAWVPNTDTLPWRGTAAGGGYSTVGDLLRFAQALSSGTLISKAMLAEATRPHRQQYGYGFAVRGEDRCAATGTAAARPA